MWRSTTESTFQPSTDPCGSGKRGRKNLRHADPETLPNKKLYLSLLFNYRGSEQFILMELRRSYSATARSSTSNVRIVEPNLENPLEHDLLASKDDFCQFSDRFPSLSNFTHTIALKCKVLRTPPCQSV